MVASNAWMSMKNDSERQNWERWWWLWTSKQMSDDGSEAKNEMVALNTKMKMWLWMPNMKWTMALSAKRKMNNGSERQKGKWTMALTAKWENEQWLWTPNRETTIALNAKLRNDDDGSERWSWGWGWLWTLKLRSDDGSERQNWKVMKALNAKLKIVMAMNAKTEKQWWWLWMSN